LAEPLAQGLHTTHGRATTRNSGCYKQCLCDLGLVL